MYLVALVFPPVACLMCRGIFSALVNVALCCAFVVPGIVHALYVVRRSESEKEEASRAKLAAMIAAAGR